jgi:aromatic ring-opening dioxygenase LigB subunit
MIVFSAIMPHPPMSVPGVGSRDDFLMLAKTLEAFDRLRIELEVADPDTIVVISPHAHLEPYAFVINSESELKGSLSKFGSDRVYEYRNNIEIADKLAYVCLMNDMPAHLHSEFLDHGAIVPLYHLTPNIKPKIVHLSFSMMSYKQHYRYGEIVRSVIDSPGSGRVAVIASGDLSHKILPNSPAGFSPGAQEFDHAVIRYLGSNDLVSLMNMEPETIEMAAECGLRSIIVLLGILHDKKYKFELLSYEAPFGIGYLTARLL